MPDGGQAQTLDLSLTDPEAIAAQCGGDPNAGAPHFEALCSACHATEAGAESTGPNLHAVYGRAPGSLEGYDFTPAMDAWAEGSTIWERESLHAFLSDPAGHVPGMSGGGAVTDTVVRTDLMTWLRVNTTPPPPAPEDVVVPEEVLAMEGDRAYGEYLWGECAGCHVVSGEGISQYSEGLDRDAFIRALFEYRARARPNQTMQNVAGNLGDAEIAALAAHFEEIRP